MEHKAVAEAGVIGKPDPGAYEFVKAFVALKPGYEPSDSLRRELIECLERVGTLGLRGRRTRPYE